jgi:hypothetical protein
MIDFQVAFDKLAQFETADELADFFKYEGVKACVQDPSNCAVAQWMNMQTGEEVRVSPLYIFTSKRPWGSRNETAVINTPNTPAMTNFILNFDTASYPELLDMTDAKTAEYRSFRIAQGSV